MDPTNLNAMFGPFESDFDDNEKRRKVKRDLRNQRRFNYKLAAQCHIMIRQIKDAEKQTRINMERRAFKEGEALRLKEELKIAIKVYQNEIKEIMLRTANRSYNMKPKNGQMQNFFNDYTAKQHNYMKMLDTLEKWQHEEPDKFQESRSELLVLRQNIQAKRAILESKKKLLDEAKKNHSKINEQKQERRAFLLKEIERCDAEIKELDEPDPLKLQYLSEIEELKIAIDTEKNKGQANELKRVDSCEDLSMDLQVEMPVFKDPNDFLIMSAPYKTPPGSNFDKTKKKNKNKPQRNAKENQAQPLPSPKKKRMTRQSSKRSVVASSSKGTDNSEAVDPKALPVLKSPNKNRESPKTILPPKTKTVSFEVVEKEPPPKSNIDAIQKVPQMMAVDNNAAVTVITSPKKTIQTRKSSKKENTARNKVEEKMDIEYHPTAISNPKAASTHIEREKPKETIAQTPKAQQQQQQEALGCKDKEIMIVEDIAKPQDIDTSAQEEIDISNEDLTPPETNEEEDMDHNEDDDVLFKDDSYSLESTSAVSVGAMFEEDDNVGNTDYSFLDKMDNAGNFFGASNNATPFDAKANQGNKESFFG